MNRSVVGEVPAVTAASEQDPAGPLAAPLLHARRAWDWADGSKWAR